MSREDECQAALVRLLAVFAAAYHGRAEAEDVFGAVAEAERVTGVKTGIVPMIGQPETGGRA